MTDMELCTASKICECNYADSREIMLTTSSLCTKACGRRPMGCTSYVRCVLLGLPQAASFQPLHFTVLETWMHPSLLLRGLTSCGCL